MQAAATLSVDTETDDTPINWRVIGLLLIAAFTVILNETTLGVALPHVMSDLAIDARTAQWLTTAFLLTMSVVIPTTGFVMDRLTTRQVFMLSMGLFVAGTIVCASAQGFGILLVGRIIQASGTAVMMPLLTNTILNLVPIAKRGQTMGLVSICISMAPAMGPTVSGFILHSHTWRWIFIFMIPVGLIATVLGTVWLTNVGEVKNTPIDPVSVALSAVGFGGLVYALNQIGQPGQGLTLAVFLVISLGSLTTFVVRQLRLQRGGGAPLLDLRTFTRHNFRAAVVVMMLSFMALMGGALIWPLYLQDVRGIPEINTGAMLLPGGLAMGLLGPLVGRIFDRVGARPLVIPAGIVMTGCLLMMSQVDATTPVWMLIAVHSTLSLSLSFLFTPCFTSALNSLSQDLYAHGSAASATLQQVAGAAGAALLITIMETIQTGRLAQGVAEGDALMAGVRTAFIVAASIGIGCTIAGGLIRRQTSNPDQVVAAH